MKRWKIKGEHVSPRLPQGQYTSFQFADWWVQLMDHWWQKGNSLAGMKWVSRRVVAEYLENDGIAVNCPEPIHYVLAKFEEEPMMWIEEIFQKKEN